MRIPFQVLTFYSSIRARYLFHTQPLLESRNYSPPTETQTQRIEVKTRGNEIKIRSGARAPSAEAGKWEVDGGNEVGRQDPGDDGSTTDHHQKI